MTLKVAEPLLLAWIGRRIEPSWILGIPALDYAVLTTAAWALGGEMVEYREGAKPGQDNRCRTSSTPQASRHAGTCGDWTAELIWLAYLAIPLVLNH